MNLAAEISRTLADPRMLHAAIVHLPVALAVLGPLLVGALVVHRGHSPALRRGAVALYGLLALTTLAAVQSGAGARARLGTGSPELHAVVARHARLARPVWALALLTAAGAASTACRSRRGATTGLATCALGAALCAGWVALVGHLGGSAVHVHGAGASRVDLAAGASPASDPRAEHFRKHVRPLIERACAGCHGPGLDAGGGLDLTSMAGILSGGRRGPALVPGDAEASLLYRAVGWADGAPRMPLDGARLAPAELEALRAWIDRGAVWDERAPPGAPAQVSR